MTMTEGEHGHRGEPDHAHGSHGGGAHDMSHGSMPGMDMSDHARMFGRLAIVMAVLAVPTVVASPMFADLLGYALPDTEWIGWVSPALGTVMYAWGGRPFLSGAVDEIRDRRPGMMLLIGLAITTAFLSSWAATLGWVSHDLDAWWELATLILIMLVGHWLEMRSLAATGDALQGLAALLPDQAERVAGDGTETETVAPADLRVGDVVVVRPGASIPADGEVTDGEAAMDESMLTGESRAVQRGPGEHVTAGTVATDSGLRVRVTAVGEDTALAGIQKMVSEAQSSSSRAQLLADRAAGWLFWFALTAAAATAVVWTAIGEPSQAVERVITVLVIACPHALGLAIPLVVSLATGRAAKAGILIRDRRALEAMRTVDVVVFDKTGTLTSGRPEVARVRVAPSIDEGDAAVLALAAAAESDSEHPLARAIVAAAQDRGLTLEPSEGFHSEPATGVTARVGGHEVRVGGPHMLEDAGVKDAAPDGAGGATVLHVLRDGAVLGSLELRDTVRPESAEAVRTLQERGVEVVMITGDAEEVAAPLAEELGIRRHFAGVRPQDKAHRIEDLQREGRTVAMVGDGVNDAPALAGADVGLAIGAGTDVAIASAGVILAGDDPRSVSSVIDLSRATYRKMLQNLWWAAGYNIVAVPLAAGVLAPIGFVLPMWLGAILMSASTVIVALNAQTLRGLDLAPRGD